MPSSIASTVVVAKVLTRSWYSRPLKLVSALAGGIGGVMIVCAVLMIAVPVLQSTRTPPLDFLQSNVVAVAANSPAGISRQLTDASISAAGTAAASRVTISSTTAASPGGQYAPVMVIGVEPSLISMVDSVALTGAQLSSTVDDSGVLVTREWSQRRGLGLGDTVSVNTPQGARQWTVRGVLDHSVANGGSALVVPIAFARREFRKAENTDVLLLKDLGATERRHIQSLIDGAATVTSPDGIFSSYSRIYRTPIMLVSIFGLVALLAGMTIIFSVWRITQDEMAPTLARLRLVGATTKHLVVGSALVSIPFTAVSYALGATAGVLVGSHLTSFREQLVNFTGHAFGNQITHTVPLVGSAVVSAGMFGAAWVAGLITLRRVAPIDAIAQRDRVIITPAGKPRSFAAIGLCCVGVATALTLLTPRPMQGSAAVPLLVGIALLCWSLPALSGALIHRIALGPLGIIVGRQLQAGWRRNGALAVTFAISLLAALTLFGVAASLRSDIDRSVDRLTLGALYVAAAPVGANFAEETISPKIRQRIAQHPGVEQTDTFSYTNVALPGGRIRVECFGGDVSRFNHFIVSDGKYEIDAMSSDLASFLRGSSIAVSNNLARTQGLSVGSQLTIPTPNGHVAAEIVAIIEDSTSDGGMVIAGEDLFRDIAGTYAGSYTVGIVPTPGTDLTALRADIQQLVAPTYPRAQVLSATDYRYELGSNLSRLMISFTAFAWITFAIAGVVGAATLATVIDQSRRAAAVVRLSGGRKTHTLWALGIMSTITVTLAWAIAVPATYLAVRIMISVQAGASGLTPVARIPPEMVVSSLPLALITVVVALSLIANSSLNRPLWAELSDE
ncbi:ABC transporter permease [Nocardia xishanensis]